MTIDIEKRINKLASTYQRDNNLVTDIGRMGDTEGKIDDKAVPGHVWVQEWTGGGYSTAKSILNALPDGMEIYAGMPVEIGIVRVGNVRKRAVVGKDRSGLQVANENPGQKRNPYISQQAITTLLVKPTDPPSLKVQVIGGSFVINDTTYTAPTTDDSATAHPDLEPLLPSSGEHCYVCVYILDGYTGYEVTASTPKSTLLSLDDTDIDECHTTKTTGSEALWAIRVDGDMTSIENADVYVLPSKDLRPLFTPRPSGGSGSGSVSSVAFTAAPSGIFDVSGSPITSSGTIALSMDNQNANVVLAGPSSGGAATPAFRSLVDDDIPAALTLVGGTINNTVIGGVTPAAGTFSALQVNGSVTQIIATKSGIYTHANTDTRTYTFPDASGGVVLDTATQTLTNKTLTTPVIGSFVNATHSHQDAAGGGTLDAAAIASGTLNNSRVNWASPGTIGSTTPSTGKFTTVATPIIGASTDGTSGLKVTKADLSTAVAIFDTTNSRMSLGSSSVVPARTLHLINAAPLRMGTSTDYVEFIQRNTNVWGWFSSAVGNYIQTWDTSALRWALGSSLLPRATLDVALRDGNTSTVVTGAIFSHGLNTANAGANGIGVSADWYAADSTSADSDSVKIASIIAKLPTATHASRTGQMDFTVTDASATRTVITLGANGSAATLSFFAATAVAQNANTVAIDTGLDNYGLFASGRSAAKFDNPLTLVGKITTYNNIATEGYGVPAIVDMVALTAQTADIGSTNCTNAGTAGLYRVSAYLQTTTADGAAGTVTLTFTFTDDVGSTTQTITQTLATTGRQSIVFFVRLASGNLTYSTTHTGSYGTAAYAVHFDVERVN